MSWTIFCLLDALFWVLITVKNGDEITWVFYVCQVLADAHKSHIALNMRPAWRAQLLISCQGGGGWNEGGAPVISWAVLGWSQLETDEDVALEITIDDISILWQTYGCKMGKIMDSPWEPLLCCSSPQYSEIFYKWEVSESF